MGAPHARADSGMGAGDRWRIDVDRSLCIGSASCLHHAPDGFRLDTGRQSNPVEPEANANEKILAAAEACPVEAIVITLLESGEPVFPPEE
ncbi:ferredoxin [Streptomyces sp. NPDC006332]|uniref:ferredoxin n=1 Tax=Streptomyces sp. NPDC006332 TaxID=3155456 RepID=UPI0033BBEA05